MYASGNALSTLDIFAPYYTFLEYHLSCANNIQPEKIRGTPGGDVVVGESRKSIREVQCTGVGQVVGGRAEIGGRSFTFLTDLG